MAFQCVNFNHQGIGSVQEKTVYFEGSQYSDPSVMTCDGSVPNSVGKRYFSWRWYATYINYDEFEEPLLIGDSGTHDYYTLLAAPQSPMAEPWTSVLDYACVWASGQSYSSNVDSAITEGIYYNLGDQDGDIDYDWPLGKRFYSSGDNWDWRTFDLTDFFYDINHYSTVLVNCSDIGKLVNIFTAAIGCNSQSKIIYGGFSTNSIDPIGSPGWNTANWSYHQYGWFNNKVYDACIKIDRYGNPRVPVNMTQSTYDSYLLAPGENYSNSNTGTASVE